MKVEQLVTITLVLGDCMEAMKKYVDGQFDLAIVDPPWGCQRTVQIDEVS